MLEVDIVGTTPNSSRSFLPRQLKDLTDKIFHVNIARRA